MATLSTPDCPDCHGPMVSRKSARGVFWGCAKFPTCRGTRNVDGDSRADERESEDRRRGGSRRYEGFGR